jgi:uncharacterized damage-inducible protein DinB
MKTRDLIIGRLAEHLDELEGFTQGLSEQQRRERPARGEWSLHEHAIHIMEMQEVCVGRLTHMLVEDEPELTPFVLDQARQDGLYLAEDLKKRMGVFREQRKTLAALLSSLEDAQWKREGKYPNTRHYTVERCMEGLMRHEEHHLYRMYCIFFGVNE